MICRERQKGDDLDCEVHSSRWNVGLLECFVAIDEECGDDCGKKT
jgi:hypothetical protein